MTAASHVPSHRHVSIHGHIASVITATNKLELAIFKLAGKHHLKLREQSQKQGERNNTAAERWVPYHAVMVMVVSGTVQ